ncbi:sensor domain-containing diguanylate cyclase [Halomonas sp. M4R1S46]|uniref:sensor domain-containing diguanylate cyclase n=1 Tax=Halomonas sp. M4R1S46 TaxID=2982692 RepID=UPI0021E38D2A|nr:sensor domain-containing diguanylate cyclase [Halomonas sp. M4R1S46]UYG08353.1 sensor domain-containing diguanylate cyclase [Halomonas sp. M4R1S46]
MTSPPFASRPPGSLDEMSAEVLRRHCLRLEERLFWLETLIEGARAGTWQWNVQTGETCFNALWAEMIGYRLEELEPVSIDTWLSLVHPDDLARCEAALQAHFSGQAAFYACDARIRHRDGHWLWVRDYGRVVTRTPEGEPEWAGGIHIDISDHKATEARLEQALDDTRRLSERLRRMDVPCRLGGEEFAILLPETSLAGGLRLAEDIRRQVAALFFASARHERFHVSITGGVAVMLASDASGEEAIQRADAALYRGKHRGRNRVVAEATAATDPRE